MGKPLVINVCKTEMDFGGEGIIIHPNSIAGMETLIYNLDKRKKELEAQLERVREIQKKSDKPFIDDRECSWIDGWNDCLDEVTQALEK